MNKTIKKKKAFTLVELLVVVIVIAILATIAVVSYGGAQKKSRDDKRKSDLSAIASAFLIYYQDAKSWAAPTGTSDGWMNCTQTGPGGCIAAGATKSTSQALVDGGYLSSVLMDPRITDGNDPQVNEFKDYLKYTCYDSTGSNKIGIALFAKLESVTVTGQEFSADLNSCYKNSGSLVRDAEPKTESMNYGIMVK